MVQILTLRKRNPKTRMSCKWFKSLRYGKDTLKNACLTMQKLETGLAQWFKSLPYANETLKKRMSSKWYACSDQKYYLETHDFSSKIHPGNASQNCLDNTMDNVKPKSPGLRHDSSSVSPREKSQQKSGNTIFPAFLHFLMRNGSNPYLTRKKHSKNACRDQNYYLERDFRNGSNPYLT